MNSGGVNSQLQKIRMLWHMMFSGPFFFFFLSIMMAKVQLFISLLVCTGRQSEILPTVTKIFTISAKYSALLSWKHERRE